jgi:hypothetical protein
MSKRAFGSREGLENRRSLFNNYARLTRPAVRYAGNYTERSFPASAALQQRHQFCWKIPFTLATLHLHSPERDLSSTLQYVNSI